MQGKGVSGSLSVDWKEVVEFKRSFTKTTPESVERGFLGAGIDIYHGRARFVGKDALLVGDEELRARHFVIASGSEPRKLPTPGSELLATSDQFMELEEMPGEMIFVGGGYISFEFAHMAAAAGAKVKILHRSERVLKQFDQDLVDKLVEASKDRGIELFLNVKIASIEKAEGTGERYVIKTDGQTFEADLAVHGAGRVPQIEDLDLDEAGVETDRGRIVLNEYLQSVSNPRVYAAGDAGGMGAQLTPVASMEGVVVASTLFTNPPLASVELTEREAKEKGLDFEVRYEDTSGWYTSRRIGIRHSAHKVLFDRNGNVLGAHILGHNAEEVFNLYALAMKHGIGKDELREMIWAYPTSGYDVSYLL